MKNRLLSLALAMAMLLVIMPTNAAALTTEADEGDGAGTRTAPLEIEETTESKDNMEEEGWSWDKDTQTLTLDGFSMSISGSQAALCGIILPEFSTINLGEIGAQIEIEGTGDEQQCCTGVEAPSVTVEGTGDLRINIGSAGTNIGMATSSTDALYVSSFTGTGVISITCSGNPQQQIKGYGISTLKGDLELNSGTVNIFINPATTESRGIVCVNLEVNAVDNMKISTAFCGGGLGSSCGIYADENVVFACENGATARITAYSSYPVFTETENAIKADGMYIYESDNMAKQVYVGRQWFVKQPGSTIPVYDVSITNEEAPPNAQAFIDALGGSAYAKYDRGVISLLQDTTVNTGIEASGKLKLDLAGYSITYDALGGCTADDPATMYTVYVLKGGELTISDSMDTGKIVGRQVEGNDLENTIVSALYVAENAGLTINGGTFQGGNGSIKEFRHDGVTEYSYNCGGNGVYADGRLFVLGGTFKGGNGASCTADESGTSFPYGYSPQPGWGGRGIVVSNRGYIYFNLTPTVIGGNGGDGGEPGDVDRDIEASPGGRGGHGLDVSIISKLKISGGNFTGGNGGSSINDVGGGGGDGIVARGPMELSTAVITGGNGGTGKNDSDYFQWAEGGFAYKVYDTHSDQDDVNTNGLPGSIGGGNGGNGAYSSYRPEDIINFSGKLTGGNGGGTPHYRTVTATTTNLSVTPGTSGENKAMSGCDYKTTLVPDENYRLPESIRISCNGVELPARSDPFNPQGGYIYDKNYGKILIDGQVIDGDLIISANALPGYTASVSGSPHLEARKPNSTTFELHTSQIPVGSMILVEGLPLGIRTIEHLITTGDVTEITLTAEDASYQQSCELRVKVDLGYQVVNAGTICLTMEKNSSGVAVQTPEAIKMGQGQEKNYRILLPAAFDYINVRYSLGTLSNLAIFSKVPALVSGEYGDVYLEATSSSASTAGDSAIQQVIVTSDDYADVVMNVTYLVKDKMQVLISGISAPDGVYKATPYSGFSGQAVFKEGSTEVSPSNPVLTLLYTGNTDGGVSYSSATPPTDAGSYTLTASLENDPAYYGQWSDDFVIMKATVQAVIDEKDKTFGQPNPALTFFVDDDYLEGNDSVEDLNIVLNTTATQTSDVGEYPITLSSSSNNYEVIYREGVLIVRKASGMSVTPPEPIPAVNMESTFDLDLLELSISDAGMRSYTVGQLSDPDRLLTSVGLDSDGHTVRFTGTAATDSPRRATLQILVSSKNYNDVMVTLTFEQSAKQQVTITGLSVTDTIYNGTQHPGCTGTAGFTGGTPSNTALTYLYTGTATDGAAYRHETPPIKAGSYSVTVSLAADDAYYGTWVGDFSISRKEVTVTADDKDRDFRADNPYLTFTVPEGALATGDDSEDLGVTLHTNATRTSVVGSYEISGTSTDTLNYLVTVTPGTLTINMAPAPYVNSVSKTLTCNVEHKDIPVTISGLPGDCETTRYEFGSTQGANPEIVRSGSVTPTGVKLTIQGSDGQSATIPIIITMQNYQKLTIYIYVTLVDRTQVNITGVTVQSKVYDGMALTCQNGGLTCTPDYNGTLEYVWNTLDGIAPKDAGVYTLTVKIPDSDPDYIGEQVIGGITISQKPLTVKPKDMTIQAGAELPKAFQLEYTGLVDGEALTPVGTPQFVLNKADGSLLTDSKTDGTYSIVWINKDAVVYDDDNYLIQKENGTLTIKPSSSGGGEIGGVPGPSVTHGSGSVTATVVAEVKISGTTATATVTERALSAAIHAAVSAAKAGVAAHVEIKIDMPASAKTLDLTLPGSVIPMLADSKIDSLRIAADIGNITIGSTAMNTINMQRGTGDVKVTIGAADAKKVLDERRYSAIGEAPVYNLTICVGEKNLSDFDGPVTVSLPHSIKKDQSPKGVVIWYLNENGRIERIPAVFDDKTGAVTFMTTHFSFYAIGYDEVAAMPNPFSDVPEDAFYRDAAVWAQSKKITNGVTAAVFAPGAVCTRAQTVTFLWRAMGSPEPTSAVNPFTDVSSGAYYYKAVLWAVEKGITVGTGAGKFSPDAPVSRGQTVTFLWRASGKPSAAADNPFADVSSDAYYADAVMWAVSNEVTTGTGDTAFTPDGGCTRGQIVTFLYRVVDK